MRIFESTGPLEVTELVPIEDAIFDLRDWCLRRKLHDDPEASWRWVLIDNPYPNDDAMSTAAFVFFFDNTLNPRGDKVKQVAIPDNNDQIYYYRKV